MSKENVVSFNVADLAGLDTSGIAEVASRLPAAGLYTVLGESVKIGVQESSDSDKPDLPYIQFVFETINFEPANKDMDEESIQRLIGRKINDRTTLWPEDFMTEIGLVKGKYKKAGINYQEPANLGGTEDQPGWLDNMVEKVFQIRIRHRNDRAYIDWVGGNPAEKEAA